MKKFHILKYVENSTPILKKFDSVKGLKEFVSKFQKKHKDPSDGYWIDYAVFSLTSKQLVIYDDLVELV